MFQPWRYQLREAQLALQQGRLEDAERLVAAADLVRYLPGQQLLGELAAARVARAEARGRDGDFLLAWRDLKRGAEVGGQTAGWLNARNRIVQYELEVLQNHLRANDHSGALLRLEELARRQIEGLSIGTLKEAVQRLDSARRLAQHGRFSQALENYAAAAALRNDLPVASELLERCRAQAEQARIQHEALHRALADNAWTEVLRLSDELLTLTPLCPIANEARRRAWAEVGTRAATPPGAEPSPAPAVAGPMRRGIVWIDGVGGYLLCLEPQVTIGQAFPGATVDIAVQADLAREQVRIVREGEGYLIEPLAQPVLYRGRPIEAPALLSSGDEIELGGKVRIRFHRAHALSASARLEFLSRHRPRPYADGVLLMAESCVLGPRPNNHVVCRDWSHDVVLYRQDGQLACRSMEPFEIDGVRHDGRGKLTWNSLVVGNDFSFKLEPLS